MTRRASLKVTTFEGRSWLRFTASNGERLSVSEVYANLSNATRGRGDWADAMAEVLADEDDAFWAKHPELVTRAHAYAERVRQGGESS